MEYKGNTMGRKKVEDKIESLILEDGVDTAQEEKNQEIGNTEGNKREKRREKQHSN